jgi:trk system potassium uptake protein TrkH
MGAESPYSSLTAFRGSVIINLVIPFLIITGGLGFLTWNDLFHQKYRIDRYSFQTKVILSTTAVLLVIPFAYFFLIEFSAEPLKERIMMSFFQSVTPRTAGFNTADYSAMSETGLLITIFLMLCGGAPGSTAGGVKLTTIFTLTAAAISDAGRKENVIAFGRRINDEIVRRAMCLLTIYLGLLLLGTCVLCSLESISLSASMFECASALGTVGLTTGITPSLSTASKLMLASYMYFGRVGGLTLAYAAITKHARINARYPAGNLMIG